MKKKYYYYVIMWSGVSHGAINTYIRRARVIHTIIKYNT